MIRLPSCRLISWAALTHRMGISFANGQGQLALPCFDLYDSFMALKKSKLGPTDKLTFALMLDCSCLKGVTVNQICINNQNDQTQQSSCIAIGFTDGSRYSFGCNWDLELRVGYMTCTTLDTAAGETITSMEVKKYKATNEVSNTLIKTSHGQVFEISIDYTAAKASQGFTSAVKVDIGSGIICGVEGRADHMGESICPQ